VNLKSYEEMLKEAKEKLPENTIEKSRLEIPKPQTNIQGNQTFVINFEEIAKVLRRDMKHFSKFLFRELAKPGHIDNGRLILQGKVPTSLIEKKIETYLKEFVYCKECNKPDTHLEKQDRVAFLVCEACGAKQAVKNL